MRSSMKCIRYVLFVFNLVFVICGLVLIVIGAVATKRDLTEFMDNKYLSLPYILIAVGCGIFVIAFFGCCGALKYNHFMVTIYGLLILLIMVVEVAGGITAYLHKGEVEDFLKSSMNESLAQQRKDSMKIWDQMQSKLQCCGIESANDYSKLKLKVPNSCCKGNKDCSPESAWKMGCYPQMFEIAKESIEIIGGVAIGIAVIELLGCMFAWCLAHAIKKDDERR
ncbi:CD63 antigen-like [Parasteatoda tepidariorum]|uniref:CD63 antigen-like n=1 Tax=Parasteatoda tepidariorum TaxID=114398 RepID=UPI00077FA53B|nr:CD63 antigen-like [Parasteatoda tepidariorum]